MKERKEGDKEGGGRESDWDLGRDEEDALRSVKEREERDGEGGEKKKRGKGGGDGEKKRGGGESGWN